VTTEVAYAQHLALAARAIGDGQVVAAATDTLVGLLALASSSVATARVLAVKGPARRAPLPVLASDLETVRTIVEHIPEAALALADALWPGPLTLVLRARPGALAPEILAGGETVGVRVPGSSPARDLLRLVGVALTGTSANRSGKPPPSIVEALDPRIAASLSYILPGGRGSGAASAVVDCTGERLKVLRPGPGVEV
jgi:L-threonylcarbamoyladenylate synthase